MKEQERPHNPTILCLGTPAQEAEYDKTAVIGEITLLDGLSDSERKTYRRITKVFNIVTGAMFLVGSGWSAAKLNANEINTPEGIKSIAMASIGLFGFHYSKVRESALSYFREE